MSDKQKIAAIQHQSINNFRDKFPQFSSYNDADIISVMKKISVKTGKVYPGFEYLAQKNTSAHQAKSNSKINSVMENKTHTERNNTAQNGTKIEKSNTVENKTAIKNLLQARLKTVEAELNKTKSQNGFIGKAWDWIKNTTGKGAGSNKVQQEIAEMKKQLAILDKTPSKASEVYKNLTGKPLTKDELKNFTKGGTKLKAEASLNGYKEGQEMATDVAADMAAGIASVGIYTAAVAAAPFTGGGSIVAGIVASSAAGAAIKTGIKYADAKSGGRSYKSLKHDMATGAFSGALAPVTGGLGGAVGKTVAVKLGLSTAKEIGKEVATETVTTIGKQVGKELIEETTEAGLKELGKETIKNTAKTEIKEGFKNILKNPTGYKYTGGNVIKRAAASGAEMATDGAVNGTADNSFRAGLDGKNVLEAAGEGFVGGLIAAPVIGGGFKLAGKVGSKLGEKISGETHMPEVIQNETIIEKTIGDLTTNKAMNELNSKTVRPKTRYNKTEEIEDDIEELIIKHEDQSQKIDYDKNEIISSKPVYLRSSQIEQKEAALNTFVNNTEKIKTTEDLTQYLKSQYLFGIPKIESDNIARLTKAADTPEKMKALIKLAPSEDFDNTKVAALLGHLKSFTPEQVKLLGSVADTKGIKFDELMKHITNAKTPEKIELTKNLLHSKLFIPDKSQNILHYSDTPDKIAFANKLIKEQKYTTNPEFFNKMLGSILQEKNPNYSVRDIEKYFNTYKNVPKLEQSKFLTLLDSKIYNTRRFSDAEINSLMSKFELKNEHQSDLLRYLSGRAYSSGEPIYTPTEISNIMKSSNIKNEAENQTFVGALIQLTPDGYSKYSTEEALTILHHKQGNNLLYSNQTFKNLAENFEVGKQIKKEDESIVLRDKVSNLSYLLDEKVTDPVLNRTLNNKVVNLYLNKKLNYTQIKTELDEITKLAEINHSMQGKSYNLTGDSFDYVKSSLNDPKIKNLLKGRLNDISKTYDKKQIVPYDDNPYREAMLLKNDMELDPLKSYLSDYSKTNPEVANHLYDSYYLPRLSPEAKEICQKISKEYNIKVFLEDETNPHSAQLVYNELEEWQRVSGGEFKTNNIPTINLSRLESTYAKDKQTLGFQLDENNSVHINQDSPARVANVLRHELLHANDSREEYYGIVNGVDFDALKGHQSNNLDTEDLDINKFIYKNEFKNAGISDYQTAYAHLNRAEFIAVASTGDCSKYSPEFKEVLVKLGMPEYVLKMKPKKDMLNIESKPISKTIAGIELEDDAKLNIAFYANTLHQTTEKLAVPIKEDFMNTFRDLDSADLQFRVKSNNGTQEKTYRNLEKTYKSWSKLVTERANAINEEDKKILTEKMYHQRELFNSLISNYSAVKNSIADAIGERIVYNKPSSENIEKTVQKLISDIENDKLVVTNIENYATDANHFYFSQEQVDRIIQANSKKGIKTSYNEDFKNSGYTTTQLNLAYKNGAMAELQIRGKSINDLAESEHILYDIREGKDIANGNKEIEKLLSPVYDSLKKLDNDKKLKLEYEKYLKSYYKKTRDTEMGTNKELKLEVPKGVPEILNMDNIIKLHEKLSMIQKTV